MSERVKRLWLSAAFNAAAAMLNLGLVVRSIEHGTWLWPLNFVAFSLSIYMIHWVWLRIKQVKQEEKERVMDILSGKIG